MSFLIGINNSDGDLASYAFYCPGCDGHHSFQVDKWKFNNNQEKPTFTPSLLIKGADRCHLFVIDGKIVFLDDCKHKLAGKTVDMQDIGEW